ncbi:MAG TPA: transglutaminase-like domain-containing protein [Steroidobacteraceae bacterium]|nr:transglutaminase-like domain-containing protein [Steroidobacteraceae bacterium]
MEATTEVVLTDDIKAKSAELHNNPVEIYNWVRNNVQWQPTWGAIQDASHTLSAQRGNAFDISSLTIALFRASGIPARYVYGTIDVPEDKFRNWAGGFQNIDAAMDFASAGGIPVAAVTSGGRITKVRLEHVWVEAALDFIPSRGAKNRSADSWIAMDPSFKQVEVLQGLDIEQISGIDAAQLSQSFFASGTLNEAEGWATGLNPAILKDAQAQARSAVENYVNENLPTATVGDVIGGRRTLGHAAPVLAGTMPNKVIATGARFASVPVSLQQEITFAFGKDIEGYPIDPHSFPWARLNNKQVTLSFRPATSADENALRALLPEGEITDVSRLPASIPAYLIKVVPEIKVEGITVMSGSPSTLGTEVTFVFNPKFVSSGEKTFSYALPSGSYLAVAVVGGTVAPVALAKARESLTMMQRKLVSKDGSGVTGESFFGATYAAELLSYYAQYIAAGRYVGQKAAAFHQLAAGLGTFGFEPSVKTLFGIPRAIYGGGASMNVPIVNIVGTTTLSTTQKISFVMTLGTISSALEFGVPYQATAAATPTAFSGVSAVSAMQRALAQGQRIYHLSSANVSAVLPTLAHDGATLDEIRTAISSGKEVIVHERSISMTGWSGSGYVIFDPQTGEGAYKISGGQNGGFASYIFAFVVLMAAFAALSVFATLLISTGALALYALPTVLSAVNLVTYIMSLYTAEGDDLTVYAPWKAFLGVLLSALPFKIPAGLEADAKPFKIFLSAMNILLQCIALPGPFGVCGE